MTHRAAVREREQTCFEVARAIRVRVGKVQAEFERPPDSCKW
jgi:hypothetical protein